MSSAQNETEQVLRELHILLAQGESYDDGAGDKIVVDKKKAQGLLGRLNQCIYDLMEEYEMTEQSKAQAEREMRKKGDAIVEDAARKAEDVYAGSVIYTDDALCRVQDLMQKTTEEIGEICQKMKTELQRERETIQRDRIELKSSLEDLKDTQKYMRLIEEANRQIEREKAKQKGDDVPENAPLKAVKPEIKINPNHPAVAESLAMEEITSEETAPADEASEKVDAEIRVNLDAEYFKWKEETDKEEEKKPEGKKPLRHTLFGKVIKENG
jgi:hypothetical protein